MNTVKDLIKEAQVNQAAQAGYAADYQNKRLPIAVHEAKEMLKAQSDLAEELKDKKPGYVGARVSKRIITDSYARGVCRGAVECSNLTSHAGNNDPTAAETIKTAPVTDISLGYPLQLLDAVRAKEPWPQEKARKQVDKRSYADKKLTDCPRWTVYGGRGRSREAGRCRQINAHHAYLNYSSSYLFAHFLFPYLRPCSVRSLPCQVHGLSFYEFARHYCMKQCRHPLTAQKHEEHALNPDLYEAKLTESGIQKVSSGHTPKLVAGLDYGIKEEGGEDWLPLGKGIHAQPYRHDWVIARRRRPYVPVIYGAQGNKPCGFWCFSFLGSMIRKMPPVKYPSSASFGRRT